MPIRVEAPAPRDELIGWADELASLPIDPGARSCWRLVVQPLTDGSTAVSMFGSHVIADSVGAIRLVRTRQRADGATRATSAMSASRCGALPRTCGRYRRFRDYSLLPLGYRVRLPKPGVRSPGRSRRNRSPTLRRNRRWSYPLLPSSSMVTNGTEERNILVAAAIHCRVRSKLGERMGRQRATDGAVTLIIAINVRERRTPGQSP